MYRTCHFIVRGHVQGVGFRAAACDRAQALGLAGWVRNRVDGGVELRAAGEHEALERLRNWLGHGPPAARVDDVEQRPNTDTDDPPRPFSVR